MRQSLPVACDPVSRADAFHSYRARLSQHLLSEFDQQICRCQNVDVNAKHRLQLILQSTKIEKSSPRQGIDQDIEVAPVTIRAVQHRPKHTRIRCTMAPGCLSHGGTVTFQQN